MKLEQTVCSVDLARRLKRLRVPQESLFYWHVDRVVTEQVFLRDRMHNPNLFKVYSAFTVAELGELLCAGLCEYFRNEKPKYGIMFDQDKCPLWAEGDKRWMLHLAGDEVYVMDNSEADARARFLVSLIERRILKIKDLKGV